jgi:broad specificity phosphatase PhoE
MRKRLVLFVPWLALWQAYRSHMGSIIHLVRHGEVNNPDGLVYADLPGFDLNDVGRQQAFTTAIHLSSRPIDEIWSSPLVRAIRTSEPLAIGLGNRIRVHPDLTEWRGLEGWKGVAWDQITERFPGELEAYLEDPTDLSFASENLRELSDRVVGVMNQVAARAISESVIVSHQDPIHAAVRVATGRGFPNFFDDKPTHGSVHTLEQLRTGWVLVDAYAGTGG